jgi:hypothetical protein
MKSKSKWSMFSSVGTKTWGVVEVGDVNVEKQVVDVRYKH